VIEYFSSAQAIQAPADRVWQLLADIGNPEMVKGFCRAVHVKGQGAGAIRTFELLDEQGGGSVSERIEQFDAAARYYSYRLFDIGPLPLADYVGQVRVSAAGPKCCVVIYHAQCLPVGDALPSLVRGIAQSNFGFLVRRLRELCAR
jgi:Polyketide cyclase / dehydrase and lipid transport